MKNFYCWLKFLMASLVFSSAYAEGASDCLSLSRSQIVNTCSFRVNYQFCVEHPQQTNSFFDGSDAFDCGRRQMGLSGLNPGTSSALTFHGRVHWVGCRSPLNPSQVEWVPGRGLRARCE